jgi:hypothetical protein
MLGFLHEPCLAIHGHTDAEGAAHRSEVRRMELLYPASLINAGLSGEIPASSIPCSQSMLGQDEVVLRGLVPRIHIFVAGVKGDRPN